MEPDLLDPRRLDPRIDSSLRLVATSGAAQLSMQRLQLPLLPIDAAVLCDYDGLDPAGLWCDCSRPLCPHAAYLVELFPTVATARRHARWRAERFAEEAISSRREKVLRSHRLYVRWLSSTEARGHDYRTGGCGIADAIEQLRQGRGHEPAWREIKRQQIEEGADGALLSSTRTQKGMLFIYANALGRLDLSDTIEELTYPFD